MTVKYTKSFQYATFSLEKLFKKKLDERQWESTDISEREKKKCLKHMLEKNKKSNDI